MDTIIGNNEPLVGTAAERQLELEKFLPDVPSMGKKDFVVFMLLSSHIDPEPHNKGRIMAPRIWNLPASTNIILKNGDLVRYHFVSHQIPDPKGTGNINAYTEIEFGTGACVVSKFEKKKYEFMMRHPENKRNSGIYENVTPTFYLVDTDVDKGEKFREYQKQYDAETIFRNLKNVTKIVLFAKAIKVDVNQEIASIKYDCLIKLKSDPGLIELLDSPDMLLMAIVYQAFDMNIIAKKPSGNEIGYNLNNTFTRIVQIPMGTSDYKSYFTQWLKQDETGTFMALSKLVKERGGKIEEEEEENFIPKFQAEDTIKVSDAERLIKLNEKLLSDEAPEEPARSYRHIPEGIKQPSASDILSAKKNGRPAKGNTYTDQK